MLWGYLIIGQAEGFQGLSNMGAVGVFISALIAVIIALWGMVKTGINAKDDTIKTLTEDLKTSRSEKERYILEDRDKLKTLLESTADILGDIKELLKRKRNDTP
jgi:gas vesicle protein